MILSEKKLKSLREMPYLETKVSKSKDGKWIINQTTITQIRPTAYFEAIIENAGEEEVTVSEEAMTEPSKPAQVEE